MRDERYEFIENMFHNLETISVEKIIGHYVDVKPRGRHYMCLCPFHRDTKLGSFIITPDKGIWKCFSCSDDNAGNGIKFVSKYTNQNYLTSAFNIALENNVITRSDYEKYLNKKYSSDYVRDLEKRYSEKRIQKIEYPKASPEIIEKVYQFLKKNMPLTNEHMQNLKETRKLDDETIKKNYFSCVTHWKLKNNIISNLKKTYPSLSDEILMTVPGFAYDKKHNNITFFMYKGIGMLIRNVNNKITAIQIRKDTIKDGESRYVWFSSTFAQFKKDDYIGGVGCGSPKDVIVGKGERIKELVCITEGKFKAEKLAEYGNTTISLQGVGAWAGIDESMKEIMQKQRIKNVFVMLDADILSNHELFKQSIKMCNFIKEKYPSLGIKYGFWSKKQGKGIDDFIIAGGNLKSVNFIDYLVANNIINAIYEETIYSYGVKDIKYLSSQSLPLFFEELQMKTEEKLLKTGS